MRMRCACSRHASQNKSLYLNDFSFERPTSQEAFTDAARRGVDVKIIVPAKTDSKLALHTQRYNYSELLKAGVKIYERRNALLHAKTAVIDEVWSTVGSTNMDYWSPLSDDEVNAVILSHEFAIEMEKVFAMDLAESDQIQWEEWKKDPCSQGSGNGLRTCFPVGCSASPGIGSLQ